MIRPGFDFYAMPNEGLPRAAAGTTFVAHHRDGCPGEPGWAGNVGWHPVLIPVDDRPGYRECGNCLRRSAVRVALGEVSR
jgi:hypothetical protein